tara:strand:- start:94 stop:591 length:498 start_codon:yes stop_codon:yes gene_type:complete
MATSSDNTNYFRGYFNQSPGIADVGSYQVSGIPYVTGSTSLVQGIANEQQISFPAVTKSITVRNTTFQDANGFIVVLFSSAKDAGNRDTQNGLHLVTLPSPAAAFSDGRSEITFDAKVKEIYIQAAGANAAFEVYASLTGISSANMPILSGSGINTFNPADGTTP